MIFNAILVALLIPVYGFFALLPDLPDLPVEIINGGQWIITQFQLAKAVIDMLLGATFVNALIFVIIGIINFSWIYNIAMWVLRKIPVASID